jgi:hypothetical protein
MAQKQMRVDEKVYQQIEAIAKQKNMSVAEAGDFVLRYKLSQVQLADSKKSSGVPEDSKNAFTDSQAQINSLNRNLDRMIEEYDSMKLQLKTYIADIKTMPSRRK